MKVSWKPEAERLFDLGYTYAQIGKVIGRSPPRVYRVLNPRPDKLGPRGPYEDSEITKKRRLLRRWCRRAAVREGRSVESLYAQYGCSDLDRVALWDERKKQ